MQGVSIVDLHTDFGCSKLCLSAPYPGGGYGTFCLDWLYFQGGAIHAYDSCVVNIYDSNLENNAATRVSRIFHVKNFLTNSSISGRGKCNYF